LRLAPKSNEAPKSNVLLRDMIEGAYALSVPLSILVSICNAKARAGMTVTGSIFVDWSSGK
jgi:hypothetical protein